MAHVALTSNKFNIMAPLSRVTNAITDFMVSMLENNIRVREVERLSALSDAQLAKRGLRREEIVAHVFRGSIAG